MIVYRTGWDFLMAAGILCFVPSLVYAYYLLARVFKGKKFNSGALAGIDTQKRLALVFGLLGIFFFILAIYESNRLVIFPFRRLFF